MNSIQLINRQSKKQEIEKTPSKGLLSFLYKTPLGKLTLHTLFKRKIISTIGGWYMNSSLSQKKIVPFVDKYQMDMSEYIVPKGGFKTFNDFFYRKIKPAARPIQSGIVSPADGKILAFNSIEESNTFFIKGSEFSAKSFLANENIASKYEKGAMCIIRLAPLDYHRFHFPTDGNISYSKKINGYYYSVSPIAMQKNLDFFCQNIREYSELATKKHGNILIAEVGATMVGSIVQTYTPLSNVKKGDEKGYFAFGGSTLVLFFEKGKIVFDKDLIQNTEKGFETTIKMGEQIGN
ncbi:phosphatidylserine decarboxylase [Tenacibaculum maritimum]|uniref:phosphatidylserine decarboxylase n=1 Tax=Tenacibaculum maritimum TaxID=107401 RepID=UPI002306DFDD|nr:phosphatidylserine decarboxylase [Tenacibaculum maritimum]MDB0603268.1 phosphatidylserine decarboxylase [Tenacibaculum maritimum]MDB0610313.1 phosphatidylserine decarboxylase [Tenacibaculum maritimum]